jgi:hypothetical protein
LILWHAGVALAVVWNVFRDRAIDYRLVVAGALLPDLVDGPFGHRAFAHTLAAPAMVLASVMLLTRGRRLLRRRLLALPIAMFLHLVLDGVWARRELLWWPLFGAGFPDEGLLPPLRLLVVEEIAGAWALGWFVWRFRLADPVRRRNFLRSGRLVGAES